MNNLSSNLYQDMLNNKLKSILFSKSKLRGWSIFNDWFSNNNHINWVKLKEIRFKKKTKNTQPIQFDGKKIRVNKYILAML